MPSKTPARDDLSHVGQEVHRHDPDRFLTVLMAPADRREDLFTLYAFNAEVARIPEITSEPLIARMRVQWWRDVIAAIYENGAAPAGHPVAEGLAATIHRHDLPRTLFDAVIDARDADADGERLADLEALDRYVEATGGDLTRLAALILGAGDERAQHAADLVGRAYALVGLLRATPFLARFDRAALPESLLSEVGVTLDMLRQGAPGETFPKAVQQVAEGAARALAEARKHRAAVPRQAVAAYLPALLADGHLRRLRAVKHDVFHPRMALPKRRPIALMIAAWRGHF